MKPDDYMAYDGSTALVMAAAAPATAAAAFRVCLYGLATLQEARPGVAMGT